MKPRFFLRLSLLAVILASCASATVPVTPDSTVTTAIESTATPFITVTETAPAEATGTVAPTPLPVATSRGPELHATDPTTVKLASGQLQLVEFFRFT